MTPDLSFWHNLCFNHPNGSCEPTLDIYVPRAFQWYKELHNPMGFDPFNRSLKIQESIRIPTPKLGAHLGVWRFIPSLSHIPGSMEYDSRASLLARTFASPCLGRGPKVRVATSTILNLKNCSWPTLFSPFQSYKQWFKLIANRNQY